MTLHTAPVSLCKCALNAMMLLQHRSLIIHTNSLKDTALSPQKEQQGIECAYHQLCGLLAKQWIKKNYKKLKFVGQ